MRVGFLICGPSGVGKSSHVPDMLKNAGLLIENIIDPDKLSGTHKEQSESALNKVYESIESKQSFVYTATCGGMRIINDIIKKMKENKFKTIIAIAYTKLGTALERIVKRDQPVPEDVVKDLHAFFKTKAERFMKLDAEIYLYNNETDFNLLYSKTRKKILCTPGDFYFDISKYCR